MIFFNTFFFWFVNFSCQKKRRFVLQYKSKFVMPSHTTSVAARVAGTCLMLLYNMMLVLLLKSTRHGYGKISALSAGLVAAGSLLTNFSLFERGGSAFEGCLKTLSQAFGVGSSQSEPSAEGQKVAHYLSKFGQSISENNNLFDLVCLVCTCSCSLYILHRALINKVGSGAGVVPNDDAVAKGNVTNDKGGSSSSWLEDGVVRFALVLAAVATYGIATESHVNLARLCGHAIIFLGYCKQVALLGPSSPNLLVVASILHAWGSSSFLTSMVIERASYGPRGVISFIAQSTLEELHLFTLTLVQSLLSFRCSLKGIMGKQGGSSGPLLGLTVLVSGLIFFGPSGYGWIYRAWGINTKLFLAYSYLLFTLCFGATMFLCGACGLIVTFGLLNALSHLHGLNLNELMGVTNK